ncbi:hypothetical protein LA080_014284 [Diaporthe eres]|nr:hypothetical protein LA080_014284 [Diaporthe eres]
MNSFKWPGNLISDKQPYRELSDEAPSDIGSEDHLLGEASRVLTFKSDRKRPRFLSVSTILHLACFTFYTALFFVLSAYTRRQCADDQTQVWSPARSALKPIKVLFQNEIMDPNPFRGPPRPELDMVWDELTQYTSIRVTAEDLRKINRTSVQLSDGSGMYFSGLNVHHQLHCLKMIRQAMYPDYYFKGGKPPRHQEDHIDHCIDNIRMVLMCKADISLATYDWVDNNRKPLTHFHTEHSCYDFAAIDDWARQHNVNMYDNVSLVHPFLGKSYPLDANGKAVFIEDGDPFLGNKIIPPPV